VKIMHK